MVLLETMQLLHYIGIAWGVGGATIGAILMAKSKKNPEITPHLMKIMPSITKLMWAAIILLIVSGIALALLVTRPMDATILAVKHVFVVLLVLNGLILIIKKEKYAKIGGPAGLVLWYLILVLSVVM